MDSILNLIANGENMRLLVTLAFICCGYVLLNSRMSRMEYSIKSELVAIHTRIDELKHNDIAHLNSTIEALTYALGKNGALKPEDKAYVDSRLATV